MIMSFLATFFNLHLIFILTLMKISLKLSVSKLFFALFFLFVINCFSHSYLQ